MRYALLLLLVGCASYEAEYEELKSRASKHPAWTPSPEGSSSELESKLLRLLEPEKPLDLSSGAELEDLVRLALARNPDLRAALKRFEAALEQVPQAASAPDPELRLAITVEEFFEKLASFMVELMMPLIFPGKLDAAARVALETAWEAWERVQERTLEVRAQVAIAYAELHAMDHALRIAGENRKLVEQLEIVARTKFEARQVPQQDVLKVRVRSLQIENDILRMTRERREAEAMLNMLLGRPDMAPIGPAKVPETIDEPGSFASLLERALQQRPEVAAATHGLKRSLGMLRMAELDLWPDFAPGVEYERMRGGDWTLEPSLTIPLTFLRPGRRAAARAQARAMLGESWHMYEAARVEIARQVAAAHARVVETRASVELYRDRLRPQAKQTYEAALAGYRSGEVDFLTSIDALLEYQMIEEQYYRLLGDQLAARETLRRAVGGLR